MEGFSQSRGDDDLFDDEIVPLSQPASPVKETAPSAPPQVEQVSHAAAPSLSPARPPVSSSHASAAIQSNHASSGLNNPRGGRGQAGRGRGARGAGPASRGGGGLADSRFAPQPKQEVKTKAAPPSSHVTPAQAEQNIQPQVISSEPIQQSAEEQATSGQADAIPATATEETTISTAATISNDTPNTSTTSTVPIQPANTAKPPSVRGDRTATGGLSRPKLTEAELSAKLSAAKLRSQNLSAAHARAQADAAEFEERERVANTKRRKEVVQKRELDGEREKNRLRKLKGVGGREWDAEKRDEDFDGRGRGARRAPGRGLGPYRDGNSHGPAHGRGTDDPDDLRMYEWNDNQTRGRGRGRRGSGRGREGHQRADHQNPIPSADNTDFPALPVSTNLDKGSRPDPTPTKTADPAAAAVTGGGEAAEGGGGSWAEQVELSEAASTTAKS